jgi:hypothetical protein
MTRHRALTASALLIAVVLTGCTTSKGPAKRSSPTTTPSHVSQTSATAVAKKVPKLGQPGTSHNTAGQWQSIKLGCIEFQLAPVSKVRDPIREIHVSDTCKSSRLPVAAAVVTVPHGTTACVAERPNARPGGPHVEVRSETGLPGRCDPGERAVRGR